VKKERELLISKIRTYRIMSKEYSTNRTLLPLRKKKITRK
jgi:hypothetical protein